ncbi:hypothetical protein Naga_100597g5 [Nannochloropsis gaditana]|uniref:Uncharacterized protein n=1 Tax=Nannochloropsis gaditana TaxID=72520 RepID=W7T5H2_9STRA|nr:hypothetical protein Naga_100597g5 [Nannochloropsis gaditana]
MEKAEHNEIKVAFTVERALIEGKQRTHCSLFYRLICAQYIKVPLKHHRRARSKATRLTRQDICDYQSTHSIAYATYQIKMRVSFALVALMAAVILSLSSAFVPPTPRMTRQARTVSKMTPMDVVSTESIQAASDVLLAAKDTDFGGYTGPIAGLITLGALILVLAPPLTTKPTEE